MRSDVNHFVKPRGPQSAEDLAEQLRGLPAEQPAPYDWADFKRRRDRITARRTFVKWPHAAAAAGLTAFVASMAMLASGGWHASKQSAETGTQITTTSEMNGTHTNRNPATVTRSADNTQATREWLARQPPEPALVRVVPRIAVANLEDRIAWFDDAMTEERMHGGNADHLQVLQRERARLMSSLAQVRYAESLAADGS